MRRRGVAEPGGPGSRERQGAREPGCRVPGGREYRDARSAGETGLKVTSWRLGRTRPDEAWIPGGENEAVAVVDCKFGLAKVRGSSL